ncbi:hypothetical protein C8J57DRAFT_1282281 [Mycena rebaudengoi]|nr:hypothetical protein C8J57DRAFT_1282281 [Mycena rebaudengoi]
MTRTTSSDDALSSLAGLNLNFPAPPTHLPPDADTTNTAHTTRESQPSAYASSGATPDEIYALIHDATRQTDQLITFFIETSAMLHTPAVAQNADLCMQMHNCLATIPATALTPGDRTPPQESSWARKRRALEENLRKYIRFSDHLVRKPPKTDRLQRELDKLHAFAEKFFHLSTSLRASTDKMRLIELCEMYKKMKAARMEERALRASIRAERAARKAERERLRQERHPP